MSLFERFESLIDEIDDLKKLHWKTPNESVWIKKVERFLKKEFGENSDYYKQFHDKVYGGFSVVSSSTTDEDFQRRRQERLEEYRLLLESFLEEVDEDENSKPISVTQDIDPKKVFVVHGHDEVARRELVEILQKELRLEPIVLMDEASQGKTVIEKFENHTLKIGYAVVLLTPDDLGCLKQDFEKHKPNPEKSDSELKPRSRENVILELGYFIGKLGRDRVCCICKNSRSLLPSDLHGIIPIIYKDSIKDKFLDIKKELEKAGYVK